VGVFFFVPAPRRVRGSGPTWPEGPRRTCR